MAASLDASSRPTKEHRTSISEHHAVVVGYGPVGRTLSRLLRDYEIEPTIVEMNLKTVQRLRDRGTSAVYGDAGQRETVKSAGVATAGTPILSASSIRAADEIARLARGLNPKIRVLARSSYLRERDALNRAAPTMSFPPKEKSPWR